MSGVTRIIVGQRVKVQVVDNVFVLGTVRYWGQTSFGAGKWVGAELKHPVGKNNGKVKGEEYFACRDNYGIFVRPDRVELVEDESVKLPPPIALMKEMGRLPKKLIPPKIEKKKKKTPKRGGESEGVLGKGGSYSFAGTSPLHRRKPSNAGGGRFTVFNQDAEGGGPIHDITGVRLKKAFSSGSLKRAEAEALKNGKAAKKNKRKRKKKKKKSAKKEAGRSVSPRNPLPEGVGATDPPPPAFHTLELTAIHSRDDDMQMDSVDILYFQHLLATHPQHVAKVDGAGNTRIHRIPMVHGSEQAIKAISYLLRAGMMPHLHARNEAGRTAVMIASKQRRYDMIRYLVSVGADVVDKGPRDSVKSAWELCSDSQTALHALHKGLKRYRRRKAKGKKDMRAEPMMHKSKTIGSALRAAAVSGDSLMMKHLFDTYKADVNSTDKDLNTALHLAAANPRRQALVSYLVTHGGDLKKKNMLGETPCHVAARSRAWEVMRYLIESGSSVTDKDNSGLTVSRMAQANPTSRQALADGIMAARSIHGAHAAAAGGPEAAADAVSLSHGSSGGGGSGKVSVIDKDDDVEFDKPGVRGKGDSSPQNKPKRRRRPRRGVPNMNKLLDNDDAVADLERAELAAWRAEMSGESPLRLSTILSVPCYNTMLSRFMEQAYTIDHLRFLEAADTFAQIFDDRDAGIYDIASNNKSADGAAGDDEELAEAQRRMSERVDEMIASTGRSIYLQFIDPTADQLIQLPARTRAEVTRRIETHGFVRDLFEDAATYVYDAIESDTFEKFQASHMYQLMLEQYPPSRVILRALQGKYEEALLESIQVPEEDSMLYHDDDTSFSMDHSLSERGALSPVQRYTSASGAAAAARLASPSSASGSVRGRPSRRSRRFGSPDEELDLDIEDDDDDDRHAAYDDVDDDDEEDDDDDEDDDEDDYDSDDDEESSDGDDGVQQDYDDSNDAYVPYRTTDLAALTKVLLDGQDLKAVDSHGNTRLHVIAKRADGQEAVDAMVFLMTNGLREHLHRRNRADQTATMLAAKYKHWAPMKYLISIGGDVIDRGPRGRLASVWEMAKRSAKGRVALYEGVEEQRFARDSGTLAAADMEHKESTMQRTLHKAVLAGDTKLVRVLLEDKSVDVNLSNEHKNTALHLLAAKPKGLRLVKYLVILGADIHLRNRRRDTPCLIAARRGNWTIVKYLVGMGASVSDKDRQTGMSVFRYAQATAESRLALIDGLEELRKNKIRQQKDWDRKARLQNAQAGAFAFQEHLAGRGLGPLGDGELDMEYVSGDGEGGSQPGRMAGEFLAPNITSNELHELEGQLANHPDNVELRGKVMGLRGAYQAQLERLRAEHRNALKQLLIEERASAGLPPPTQEELDALVAPRAERGQDELMFDMEDAGAVAMRSQRHAINDTRMPSPEGDDGGDEGDDDYDEPRVGGRPHGGGAGFEAIRAMGVAAAAARAAKDAAQSIPRDGPVAGLLRPGKLRFAILTEEVVGEYSGTCTGRKKDKSKVKSVNVVVGEQGIDIHYTKGAWYSRKRVEESFPWAPLMMPSLRQQDEHTMQVTLERAASGSDDEDVVLVIKNCDAPQLLLFIKINVQKAIRAAERAVAAAEDGGDVGE